MTDFLLGKWRNEAEATLYMMLPLECMSLKENQKMVQAKMIKDILCFNRYFKKQLCWGIIYIPGLPRWLGGKESTCQCRRWGFDHWVRKNPWGRKRQPTPVFLPWKSYGQRSPEGAGVWGSQKRHDLAIKQQSTRIIKFTILSLQCDEFQ